MLTDMRWLRSDSMAMPETLATSSKRLFVLRDLDPIFKLRASFRLPQFSLFSVPFFLTSLAECVYQFMVLYTKVHFNWWVFMCEVGSLSSV
jgi:hypothetical protein